MTDLQELAAILPKLYERINDANVAKLEAVINQNGLGFRAVAGGECSWLECARCGGEFRVCLGKNDGREKVFLPWGSCSAIDSEQLSETRALIEAAIKDFPEKQPFPTPVP